MSQNEYYNSELNTLIPPVLFGLDGELVQIRISVDPRHLEDLLDSLASLDFPVNPELSHKTGFVSVEFPAYSEHVPQVRMALESAGFDPDSVQISGMLAAVSAAAG